MGRSDHGPEVVTKVIVLNGAIGSGKDDCAVRLWGYLGSDRTHVMSFKKPLFELVGMLYSLPPLVAEEIHSNRDLKDSPRAEYGGKTSREVIIEVSEKVIKPFYGNQFFGDKAVGGMKRETWVETFIFSDSGFEEELEPVSNYVGKENVILCRIRNRGSFSNDSRSFLSDKHAGTVLDYDNSGSLEDLHKWVESVGDMILKENELDATGC